MEEVKVHDLLRALTLACQWITGILVVVICGCATVMWHQAHYAHAASVVVVKTTTNETDVVEDGADKDTGLIAKGNYKLVKTTCTACHSSSIIIRSKLSRDTWIAKIRWMQEKQKLWNLGDNEKPILDYLEKYYGPDSVQVAFRRPPLRDIVWYKLN